MNNPGHAAENRVSSPVARSVTSDIQVQVVGRYKCWKQVGQYTYGVVLAEHEIAQKQAASG